MITLEHVFAPLYRYESTLLEVIDGDTVKVAIRLCRARLSDRDLGLHVYVENGWVVIHETVRLAGLNAAEHRTPAGDAATAWLRELLPVGTALTLKTTKDKTEKYGRYLGTLWLHPTDPSVNDQLIAAGHAKAWDGHGPRPV